VATREPWHPPAARAPTTGALRLAPNLGARYTLRIAWMRVIARRTLQRFWKKHPDAEGPLKAWFAEAKKATWRGMADIRRDFGTASIIDAERVVFNIGGNKYRLVVKLWFRGRSVWIKFIDTHTKYDAIDVRKL
jgi:mRNA interferase HigB